MKILLTSQQGHGIWFALRLLQEGNSVDTIVLDKKFNDVLKGLAPTPLTVEQAKNIDYGKYDLSIFDLTGTPKLSEKSIENTQTIGDSELATELEENRMFGIEVMEEVGINVPDYEVFSDIKDAKKFISQSNKRYVFKPSGDQDTAATYVSESAEDLLDYLDKLTSDVGSGEFLLQEVVQGVEISTEAYFNGEEFYFINHTLEEKKFMNDNKGPNTGCAGNLVWLSHQPPHLFREGLGKMKDFLQEQDFRGMIDLNTIVSDTKIYGLEWTPRFGYDASATLFRLLQNDLSELFYAIASGDKFVAKTNQTFAAAIRLSIPPYPKEIEDEHPAEVPINGVDPDDESDEYNISNNYYFHDCMLSKDGSLVTAGVSGLVCVPIASGNTIAEAFTKVKDKIKRIKIPDCQYRTDIDKTTKRRFEILKSQGWLT